MSGLCSSVKFQAEFQSLETTKQLSAPNDLYRNQARQHFKILSEYSKYVFYVCCNRGVRIFSNAIENTISASVSRAETKPIYPMAS